ncbi:hypothetical protein [Anabaena sp. UHCC 0451]|uniref:hypothetical protein n=1 Tax=Anabaena sp. UHCC 0451 TaxID=2055235 RepID=UPI002B216269|nr:hypothetical protein [Anabaena sp. UHCC 0451]MEA5575501.1 hypothetical protein [Anabaena sp. UHCC 0451]
MFPASANQNIDENLKNAAKEIETENPGFSVLAARKFRYSLSQNTVELTIKEPRQFNVLEEFIIRAGIEFELPPTADELASILGLDSVFIKSTISTLQSLQTLAVESKIIVTAEGRSFHEKGTVPQPPYTVQVYAINNYLEDKLTVKTESLNDVTIKLPDLSTFVKFKQTNIDISSISLEQIQQIIQDSGLTFHLPEQGKVVTAFKLTTGATIFWKTISLFVIFDANQDKLNIQIRSGKRILEPASNWLESLLNEGKISLTSLCDLSEETINSAREAIIKQRNSLI